MIDSELKAALTKLDDSVRELEEDYNSKPEPDQADHLYHALMIVAERFICDENASVTMVVRAVQGILCGRAGVHGGPF